MHRKAKAYYSNKSSSRVRVKSNGSDSIMDWENELADEDDDEDVPSPSPKSSKHRAIKDEIMEDFSGIFGNDDKKEVKMHSKLKIPPIDR
jgi:hypothetical protein